MLKHGDYLKPFTREDAMDIIAFAHMAKFPMHKYRKSDHRALMFGPDELYFSKENGLCGGSGHGGRPLTKREFLTHIANSDTDEKFEACSMYKLGIEPGAIVKPDSGPAFVVPPYTMWTPLSDAYAWMEKDAAPHNQCWLNQHLGVLVHSHNVHPAGVEASRLYIDQWVRFKDKEKKPGAVFKVIETWADGLRVMLDNNTSYSADCLLAVSAAKIPQPMEDNEIRVGDTVERIKDNNALDKPHFKKGFIGIVTEINGDDIHFGTPGAVGDRDKYRKIPAKTLLDDVIRVGDTVRRVSGGHHRGMNEDDTAVVKGINSNCLELEGYVGVIFNQVFFEKVKAGGPASTIQQQPHEYQVSGAKVQKREPVEGRCVQRPVPGRSCAVGSRHQGHGARAAVSRAKCRNGFISFTIQWSPDPPAGR